MSKKITVQWQVSGQGEIEIAPIDVEDLTDDEVRAWVWEGAEMAVMENHDFHIELSGMKLALEQLKEDRESDAEEETP